MKNSKFPQSLRFWHNGSSLVCTSGVKYVEKLDGYFFLHWESLWPGVDLRLCCSSIVTTDTEQQLTWWRMARVRRIRAGAAHSHGSVLPPLLRRQGRHCWYPELDESIIVIVNANSSCSTLTSKLPCFKTVFKGCNLCKCSGCPLLLLHEMQGNYNHII